MSELYLNKYLDRPHERNQLIRHFILVFVAYTFILYQKLMGGLRKRYASKPLTTFAEILEAFLTGISYGFFCWLQIKREQAIGNLATVQLDRELKRLEA